MKDDLIMLAHKLEDEENAASDLWTWLPSYEVANHFHGDYASDVRPGVCDVMIEASIYLASLAGCCDAGDEAWFTQCPCGDPDHEWIGPKYQSILESRGQK